MILGRASVAAGLILFALGLVLDVPLVMAAAFVFLLAAAAALVFRTRGLLDVTLSQSVEPQKAFPGDEVTYTIEIANLKRLPLPFLTVEGDWPEEVTLVRGNLFVESKPRRHLLRLFFNVGPREIVRRRMHLTPTARGFHRLGPTVLRLADPLGLTEAEREFSRPEDTPSLTVYPKVHPVKPPFPFMRLGGSVRAPSLLDDPTLVRSLRDWRPGDPMRTIDWRASARLEEGFVVRQNETVRQIETSLFVNLHTARHPWDGTHPPYVEAVLEAAASLAVKLRGDRLPVGLYVNGVVQEQGGKRLGVSLSPSSQPRQLEAILTALAAVEPAGSYVDIATLLLREAKRRAAGATFILLTAFLSESLATALAQARRQGVRPVVVQFWDETPEDGRLPPDILRLTPREVFP